MSNHINGALNLQTDPNSSLLCQLFIENDSANTEELQELSQKYNISYEVVSLKFKYSYQNTSKRNGKTFKFQII